MSTGLVRSRVKAIKLLGFDLHVCELQAMLENFTGLQTLELSDVCLYATALGHGLTGPTGASIFSLERHFETLERLSLNSISATDEEQDVPIEARWFDLTGLSVLKSLQLKSCRLGRSAFSQLSALKNLRALTMYDVEVDDRAIEALLPTLPFLRSLCLRCVEA